MVQLQGERFNTSITASHPATSFQRHVQNWAGVVLDEKKRAVHLDSLHHTWIKTQKPLDRTMQFWRRSLAIYFSYKICQFRVHFMRSNERRDKTWEEQHERAADKLYSLCSELGGFFLKIFGVCGSILNIAKCATPRTTATEMLSIIAHLRSLCTGTRMRRGKNVSYSADLVLLDFPTDIIPDGFGDVPEWNKLDATLFESTMHTIAIVDDGGLVITIVGVPQIRLLPRVAKKGGLKVLRHAILRGIGKFGVTREGIEVYMLCIYILCRVDALPQFPMGDCDSVDPSLFSSMSDHWVHYLPVVERLVNPSTSIPMRGGMEKSPHLLHFLVEMCCKPSGVVVDPFLGCGGMLYACRVTGRHCVAMNSNQATLDLGLKRYGMLPTKVNYIVLHQNKLGFLNSFMILMVGIAKTSTTTPQITQLDFDEEDDEEPFEEWGFDDFRDETMAKMLESDDFMGRSVKTRKHHACIYVDDECEEDRI